MGIRSLDFVKPIRKIIPEIEKPARRITKREKVSWTIMALFIFLEFRQMPLFGSKSSPKANLSYS